MPDFEAEARELKRSVYAARNPIPVLADALAAQHAAGMEAAAKIADDAEAAHMFCSEGIGPKDIAAAIREAATK